MFGYELKENSTLECVKKCNIPAEISDTICQLIYLLNETDISDKLCIKKYESEENKSKKDRKSKETVKNAEKFKNEEDDEDIKEESIIVQLKDEAPIKILSVNLTKIRKLILGPQFIIGCE